MAIIPRVLGSIDPIGASPETDIMCYEEMKKGTRRLETCTRSRSRERERTKSGEWKEKGRKEGEGRGRKERTGWKTTGNNKSTYSCRASLDSSDFGIYTYIYIYMYIYIWSRFLVICPLEANILCYHCIHLLSWLIKNSHWSEINVNTLWQERSWLWRNDLLAKIGRGTSTSGSVDPRYIRFRNAIRQLTRHKRQLEKGRRFVGWQNYLKSMPGLINVIR